MLDVVDTVDTDLHQVAHGADCRSLTSPTVPSAVLTNAPKGRVFVIVTVTVSPSVRAAGCCSVMVRARE